MCACSDAPSPVVAAYSPLSWQHSKAVGVQQTLTACKLAWMTIVALALYYMQFDAQREGL